MLSCILEGMGASKTKPVNFNKLAAVDQGLNKNPNSFLERLWEALLKYINLDPDLPEGDLIIKDRFLIKAAPDIQRKLQKLGISQAPPSLTC